MPRYSRAGLIAGGVAGGVVTRAGVVIASPAGGACWLDDARILYGCKVGEPDVWGLRAHDGQRESKVEAVDTPATDIRAGGGVWAVWSTSGIRSNSHPPFPMAGLHDVGPDGTLAFCADRQDGRGLILRGLDGTQTVLVPPVAACFDVQAHDARNATWVQGGRIRSTYGDPTAPAGTCGVPRVVTRQGKRLLLYFYRASNGKEYLLCQTDWSQPVGYIVTQEGRIDWPAHRPDLMDVDTVLRACWATSEGEGPASLREAAINFAQPLVDFRTLATTAPIPSPHVPTPSPTPQEPEPVSLTPKRLSAVQQSIVDDLYEQYTELAEGNDEARRALAKMIAETWRARLGPRFGWKSNHGIDIANSKDGGAEIPEGDTFTPNQRQRLYLWDLFNGSTRKPHRFPLSEEDNQKQFFVPVEPIDHLDDQPVPVPVPVPPAPVPVPSPPAPVPLPPFPPACEFAPCDLSAINARLASIEAALLALVVQNARPRSLTINGGRFLGTLTGEVGAPKL